MPDNISLTINGAAISVSDGTSVAVAVAMVGGFCRTSVSGQPRSVLCGMGICFECRVNIDGKAHCPSCQILCASGMMVKTDG